MPELVKLARHPNVAVKATGAPGYCSGPYPFRSMHPYLRQIYDAFGPERMFWGTDITKMPCSWRQCVTMFTEELPWLSGEGQGARHGPGRVRLVGLESAGLTAHPTPSRQDSDDELVQVSGQREGAVEIAPDVALDLRQHRRRHGPGSASGPGA